MFHVTGTIRGIPYRVGIHPEPQDHEDALGVVMGSEDVINWLTLNEGHDVRATPTSSTTTLDTNDPASVLAFLHGTTDVATVEGDDIPDVLDLVGGPGAVY